ncbi:phosphoribosyl-AMP cyclohydrolase [Arcanobacterium bovis]|uniref:Phosphoribosyl-AMP cyclohydrolase n=1 Tax=Arcanobacterium bovis TaxID=2529275 RepID=A0A4Q9V300_9ACTO|nr:phosphoribosyl-AMP cyclohydrolase [Arcanobacterium bovis]TBW22967.1 phosphoribosyl-AMP cyclohydrolase [Arcanobacterium bovis]
MSAENAPQDVLDPQYEQRIKFNDQGLVLAVIQDWDNKDVLMVAWMNRVALARTLSTGRVWFWSRSRQEYWRKGDTSGHIQLVKNVSLDCDGDSLLVQVEQVGSACHTGERTCFLAGGELLLTHNGESEKQ